MIVRELIHIIGFRINEAQYASMEARVRQLGSMMSFVTTVPLVLLGKSFLEASLNMDTLALSIQTYAKNTEQANAVTQELKTLAANLPTIQVKDLNETVSALLTRQIPIEELVDTFRTFAVITGATGGDMKRLTKAYTDVVGKGKLAGQELNQFVNANVPLRKALAEHLGKTTAQLMDMQKKGQISAEMTIAALKDMAKEGGAFSNIMAAKADLLWGKWQKFSDLLYFLKDQLGKKLEIPLKKVLDVLGKMVAFIYALDDNWKRFIIILMGVAAVIGPLLVIWGLLSKFIGPIGYITIAIGVISILIDEIYGWVMGYDSILGLMFGDYDQYEPKINRFKQAMEGLWISLKESTKDVLLSIIEIFAYITGEKGSDFKALNIFLEVLTAIADTLADVIFGLTFGFRLISSFIVGKEKGKEMRRDLMYDASQTGGNFMSPKTAVRYGKAVALWMNETMDYLKNADPTSNPLVAFTSGNPIAMYLKDAYANKFVPATAGARSANEQLSTFNPQMYLTVNAPGADTASLIPAIQKVFDDSIAKVSRDIKSKSGK